MEKILKTLKILDLDRYLSGKGIGHQKQEKKVILSSFTEAYLLVDFFIRSKRTFSH